MSSCEQKCEKCGEMNVIKIFVYYIETSIVTETKKKHVFPPTTKKHANRHHLKALTNPKNIKKNKKKCNTWLNQLFFLFPTMLYTLGCRYIYFSHFSCDRKT